jgi:hypothetical protein
MARQTGSSVRTEGRDARDEVGRYYDASVIVGLGWPVRLFFDFFVFLSSVNAASAADRA